MIGSVFDGSVFDGSVFDGSVFDGSVASPFALVHRDALAHNVSAMQAWCAEHGVELAPHGKTTMAPAIFEQQLAAGAWGMTVANAAQAQVAVRAGATRVIVANEVADVAGIRLLAALLAQHPGLRMLCYVDSVDAVELLDSCLDGQLDGRRFEVLLELGLAGQRAGLRDDEVAVRVARAVASTSTLTLAGVAAFEGVIAPGTEGVSQVAAFCDRMVAMGRRLVAEGLLTSSSERPAVLSAGGSIYFDTVAQTLRGNDFEAVVVLRSGCYVMHDHGLYGRVTPLARGGDGPVLQPALEVCTRVLSRPEPTRVILDAGRRDVSYDVDLPAVLWARGASGGPARAVAATVVALSDQHAWVDLDAGEALAVGEWVGLGVSHPCTTFDKWRSVLVVDGDGFVVERLATFF